jgi:membrane protein involved in colicin uptake
MEQDTIYMSLYDYLGRAAGQQLGAEVNKSAVEKKIEFQQRFISNPAYHGNVHLYPVEFLNEYFKGDMSRVKGDTRVSEDVG